MKKCLIGIPGPLCALLFLMSWTAEAGTGEFRGDKLRFSKATNTGLLHREKRQLLFRNTTLLQLLVGVTVPTPAKDIRCNWAIQANFELPSNRTQIPTDIFLANSGYDGDSRAIKERREIEKEKETRDKKEQLDSKSTKKLQEEGTSNIETIDIKNQLNKISGDMTAMHYYEYNRKQEEIGRDLYGLYKSESRLLHLYQGVEKLLDSFGYEGSSCVLQTLCQLAKEPLLTDHDEDLLHELASFLLDPNNDQDDLEQNEENHPYLKAYARGRALQDCTEHYGECTLDVVNIITTLKHD